MDVLKQIRKYAEENGQRIALHTGAATITYEKLDELSDRMAAWLNQKYTEDKTPVVVYGHKSIFMILCFLSCVKSGRAYCPIDHSIPISRIKSIIDTVKPAIVLATEDWEISDCPVLGIPEIRQILNHTTARISESCYVKEEEVFYIIFTSGSTGNPKGVEITSACLSNFLDWAVTLGNSYEEKQGKQFLNQAPYSFDLSVMDLYTSLACGGTLWMMEKAVQSDYARMFSFFEEAGTNVWVSTPSFADMCLADKHFSQELLPGLEVFLFCGETLTNNTAEKLQQRFPDAVIMNTYGPTESTVAVTEVMVTPELVKKGNPLPVGSAKPGTIIQIYKEDGTIAEEGAQGEIMILGDTVSTGYFKEPEMTKKAFFIRGIDGKLYRGYRTGDKGYLKDGMLYYCGRMDLQIKLHGYRIECEDIEQNLLKIEGINHAVVVPNLDDGKVKSLIAYLVGENIPNSLETVKEIKRKLKELIPEYMIPKKIVFVDRLPMTNNGKIDRKMLGGMME